MDESHSSGINVSALQSYLHEQQSGGHGEDEETVFSVFVFLAWFYKNVPGVCDMTSGNLLAAVTSLGMNLKTEFSIMSDSGKNFFGLPKLLPDAQPGGAPADGGSADGGGEGSATGGEASDNDAIYHAHHDDPYAHAEYPHADQEIMHAAGGGFNNISHEDHSPQHDHHPSPTPISPSHANQYYHDM
ncbi:hypothetical protein EHRUM1_05090 [Ehrlichia ruminantium]|uniref:Uncharacterized protein n=1 Tax=Ehrlichia ruminantium (strain Welgevonden) TaxID=254945 RepID=A0A0H3M688_EHRRW|nr:hypothetical protein [Ehrlichia ruminantium]KYW99661.1 hypothetical protein AUR40_04640 [Ehrlichia ruminantium]QLK50570.1 hypothetical protein FDZ68_02765 [Ehrlichia ruminantium]QLK51495.1 hypothetical protein FDZ66_02770 [Ehrlichia ruminantium]QLK52419.1 hypothetical protein FDZ65_02770 [Ehrlichia ruminantium]QLK53330.1 hypothetical protein FDZ64_02755 [Ehrlichia ruminantium]